MSGSLKGGGATYYLVNAATGQTLKASLAADSSGCHMKLFAPGDEPGEAEALFDGSIAGNLFAATLSASGDYTAQVYKVRNAERVNELCRYAVTFEVTGEPGEAPADPPDDPAMEADGP